MLEFLFNVVLFSLAFFIITKSADFFIDEASTIGKGLGMSKLLIGLTIVAIGTSLPEMMTSLGSILFTNNYPDFIIGTTMGSNITNMLLVFGIFLILTEKFEIRKKQTFNIIALLFTTIIFAVFIILGYVNYVATGLFIYYIFYIIHLKNHQKAEILGLEKEEVEFTKESLSKSFGILVLSFCGMFIGVKLVVLSIENISTILDIETSSLTLTAISIATSLPELAVIFSTAKQKEYLMAIGNIVGTNIMNICLIIGSSALLGGYVIETSLYFIPMMIFVFGTVLFSYMMFSKKFNKYYGYFFLCLYVFYISNIFLRSMINF